MAKFISVSPINSNHVGLINLDIVTDIEMEEGCDFTTIYFSDSHTMEVKEPVEILVQKIEELEKKKDGEE